METGRLSSRICSLILFLVGTGVAASAAASSRGALKPQRHLMSTVGPVAQAADEDGVTPLMRAARDGEPTALRTLLGEGHDLNAEDAYGWTALTYAARRGDAPMIVALANKGAQLDHQTAEGLTPLMYAASEGHADAVKVLVERGAGVNITSKNGATALSLAERRNSGQITASPRDYAGVVGQLKKAGGVEGRPAPLLQLSPGVDTRPVPVNRPFPSYTEEARRHKINARIDMRILVGEDGSVKKVRVLTGAPYGLTEQAVKAAYQLRFNPALKSGKPVESWAPLSMDFSLR